jgi:tRNA(Ile)-lysidine synthase
MIARQARAGRDAVDLPRRRGGLGRPHRRPRTRRGTPALARIAVRRWVAATGLDHPIDAAAVQRILDVAAGDARGRRRERGWEVRRTDSRLRLERR